MNIKKTIILLAAVAGIFTSCKKASAPKLIKLVVTSISPTTPFVDSDFKVRVEARDEDGNNQVLNSNTTITLSLASGSGNLTGTLTKVMQAPNNYVDFTDLRYDTVESGVILMATASGGESLTGTISWPFSVTGHMLIFKFKFDSMQVRLNNIGMPSTVPPGNAAQSPRFNAMSAHYIELAQNDFTALTAGEVLYIAPEVPVTGTPPTAIDFDQSVKVGEGEIFFSVPLKYVSPGTYKWLRISLAYQNYDINYHYSPLNYDGTGTIASFIGYNTYINDLKIKTATINVGGPRLQGYWAFETTIASNLYTDSSQAPAGATTVPNPNPSSPIPAGSCVVTGQFTNTSLANAPLYITGTENNDIVVTVSVSTNKSFEWVDSFPNNLFEPGNPEYEQVVDMGVRGIIPIVQYY
jgi:hypothetical protein